MTSYNCIRMWYTGFRTIELGEASNPRQKTELTELYALSAQSSMISDAGVQVFNIPLSDLQPNCRITFGVANSP